jgi:LL-diaminopimelate aminotransferase
MAKLHAGYLFPEIVRRKTEFLVKNPDARLISLGIGDTTEPLPSSIASALSQKAQELTTYDGYTGYGPEEGELRLRKKISQALYEDLFAPDEIFISDGTNSDIGRLQVLFGNSAVLAVQDPTYPVYVDTGVMLGQSALYDSKSRRYGGICYMPCYPENQFFPILAETQPADLIYFCSPNNPTGTAATFSQLEELVAFAKKHQSVIIYDSAYSSFIQEPHIPRSIYQVKGAREVAIELGSFSKMAGFTGVRLAWSVVPKELRFENGHSLNQDWSRVHATFFNGASNLSQAGGMAVLTEEGQKGIQEIVSVYMENAAILRQSVDHLGFETHGGVNSPYLWVRIPNLNSWEAFDLLLEKGHIITAPGTGFGPGGEGFVRLSAFGKKSRIEEAADRLVKCFA